MPLTGFDFYSIPEKGNAARIAYLNGVERMIGDFKCQNLLKRFANYRRGSGNSTIRNFKWIPATALTEENKTVDLAKLERQYVEATTSAARNTARDAYLAILPMLKVQNYRMQMWPKTQMFITDPVMKREAITLGGAGGMMEGYVRAFGSNDMALATNATETMNDNKVFFNALNATSIRYKKTRWDGGIGDADDDIVVNLPAYCTYTATGGETAAGNDGTYISIPDDLTKIRAQMMNNLMCAPDLNGIVYLICSPNTWAAMINNTWETIGNSDYLPSNDLFRSGQLPEVFGFRFVVHPMCADNVAYAITDGVTLGVDDWGIMTDEVSQSQVGTSMQFRRASNYDCKIVQPLSFVKISIPGADTSRAVLGTVGSDNTFSSVRDPKGALV